MSLTNQSGRKQSESICVCHEISFALVAGLPRQKTIKQEWSGETQHISREAKQTNCVKLETKHAMQCTKQTHSQGYSVLQTFSRIIYGQ